MIQVFEPEIGEDEVAAVADAVRRGEISGSFGESIPAFERAVAEFCGVAHGVAVTSGTTALHVAVAAARLDPGDEILMSASTNIATGLAAHHNGLVVVPVDSERETWNLDLEILESLVGPRTRAIIPVHLFGHPVDMDALLAIAERHDLLVIEDAAESLGATCRGRQTGGIGDMGCLSFYANKVVTTGEGGMVLTDDDELAERLRLLRNLGFTTPRFRHEVPAFNFRMTGYQAAMGVAQMRKIDEIVERKRDLARRYSERLAGVEGLRLPSEQPWARHVHWMYALTVEPAFGASRDDLATALRGDGIETRTFFCPMNQQPALAGGAGMRDVPCPVADEIWTTGLYLPSSPGLTDADIDRIGAAVESARR